MMLDASSPLLAFAAGALATLSPCVLPLLPVVVAAALASHRLGPLALASGLALSFTSAALLVAGAGLALGLAPEHLRAIGGAGLVLAGAVLMSERLQAVVERRLAGVGAAGDRWSDRVRAHGLWRQFLLGFLLGMIWTPCAGPTLGAALVSLTTEQPAWPTVLATMMAYGLGGSAPLLLLGSASARISPGARARYQHWGEQGRHVLGAALACLGALVVLGLDKRLEAALLSRMPAWMGSLGLMF